MLGARVPRRVWPGQRVQVRLQLRRSRAGRFQVAFPYEVPRSTKPGRRKLTIRGTGSGGFDLEEIFELLFGIEGGGQRPPRSVGELSARIAELGVPRGVRVTFARKGKGTVVYRNERIKIRGKVQVPVRVLPRRGR
jgi:hypothetical protein